MDLHGKRKTIQLSEKKINGKKSSVSKLGKEFLDLTLKAQSRKEKLMLDLTKFEIVSCLKDPFKRMKNQDMHWEKKLKSHISRTFKNSQDTR